MSGETTVPPGHAALVESLADIAKRLDLSEVEYQTGDLKIRVARQYAPTYVSIPQAPPSAAAPAAVPSGGLAQAAPAAEHPGTVKSPMVGTAYLRPAPEAAPFVDIGTTVKSGDKILLVEAMKTFNEIIAPKGGIVTQILVVDGEPVEYGQALFVIE